MALRWDDVDLANGVIRVEHSYDEKAHLQIAPFQPSNLWRRAQSAWKRAGVEPIGLHEARHTFASILIAAGVNAKAEAAALVDAYLTRADSASRIAQVQPATS